MSWQVRLEDKYVYIVSLEMAKALVAAGAWPLFLAVCKVSKVLHICACKRQLLHNMASSP